MECETFWGLRVVRALSIMLLFKKFRVLSRNVFPYYNLAKIDIFHEFFFQNGFKTLNWIELDRAERETEGMKTLQHLSEASGFM